MAKDYYLILGVPLDAAPEQIRSAFHRLALRHHPDRSGAESARTFQDISEAYAVLSDPVQRARYDRRTYRPVRRVAVSQEPLRVSRPEPLVAEPQPITGRPERVRPSYDALVDRLIRNFMAEHVPKAEHPEPLNFELTLSPEEAELGVRVPLEVPVVAPCYQCGGSGRDWLFPCHDCDGEGRLVDRDAVDVPIPAGVRDGALVEVALDSLGVHNLWLRVLVRIHPH